MNPNNPIRILITDDHPVVREGLAALLARQPDMRVEGEASDGNEAIEQFRRLRPDIALMDLRMPGTNGVEAITAILHEFPDARVIVLTTYGGDEDIHSALRAGAKGYLLKDAGRDALVDAIRAVHAGHTRVPPEVAARVIEQHVRSGAPLSPQEHEAMQERALYLTEQEAETLLTLSSTSSLNLGDSEAALFGKLGDYLRHFSPAA
jgi:DNA-binding NarL/FixJ family response regulator